MGFFKRRTMQNAGIHTQSPAIGLGSGRRLHSDLPTEVCISNLEAILSTYPQPTGRIALTTIQQTRLVAATWRWDGLQGNAPDFVYSFDDMNEDVMFATFRSDLHGTEVCLFPLGVGDERLSALPTIGHMKQRDGSLTSTGVVATDQLILLPPHISGGYVEEILSAAGFPSTPRNVQAVGLTTGQMFLVQARQLIASKDARMADRFVQSHDFVDTRASDYCQSIVNDLATWDPVVLFYIQALPARVRALSLDAINRTSSIGGVELNR